MFRLFRFRVFSARLFDQVVNCCQPLAQLATQSLAVGVLATVLWLGSVGAYTQVAQAGDNLNARPYEAEAVRQSRSPASRENPASGVDRLTSKAPEDVANEALESAKDAVKDAVPGMSADRGVGQNAYNPNTQHSSNPKR